MSDVLAAARGFEAELRKRGDEIEAARRLPPDLARRFAEAGFYRLCVPASAGGLEAPPHVTMQVIETLARADGASAWCAFIGATSGLVLAWLPEEGAREVFADPHTILGGTFAPHGVAVPEDGGYRVRGQWPWGSGTENAHWVMGGCRIESAGEPVRPRMLLMPASEVRFLDTWHAAGLCGTGSTDFAVEDVFVPGARSLDLTGPPRLRERPLYAFPAFGLLAVGIGCVVLGLARAALDELVRLAAEKTPQGSRRKLAERPAAQADVAEAESLVRAGRAFLYEAVGDAWEAARREGVLARTHRRDLRLAATRAVRDGARAVDLLYHLGGGSSVYRRSPLQRIFRDTHVATQHMMVSPASMELAGRLLLGVETDTSQL